MLKKIKRLIVIAGPTASGKTALSVALAKHYSCPVVSADSRQFYKEMSIGTAKPDSVEMENVPHYFIDSHSIHEPLSAGEYAQQAGLILKSLFTKHDSVILVGGSGLFIKSLIEGIDDIPGDDDVRMKWNAIYAEKGIRYLQEELCSKDPIYFEKVDQNNPVRLIRALEVIDITGMPYSLSRQGKLQQNEYTTHYYIVNHPREILYERINERVQKMFDKGLEKEARNLFSLKDNQALNTVGYKELFSYFEGSISYNEAFNLIQQNTRRYAKRQLTWFKGISGAVWGTPAELHPIITQETLNTN